MATMTESFRNWFGASRAAERGTPLVVYHGTRVAFDAFDAAMGQSEEGFFFTSCTEDAEGFAVQRGWEGASIMPVYLSIQNPHVVNVRGELYDPEMMQALVEEAKAEGADGLIVRNIQNFEFSDWTTTYVVFRPEQIKSAIGNCGAFDPANPSITL